MIKAARGGGGKGMRVVGTAGELEPALRLARSEARSAFGDTAVYLEKAIVEPRHVEIQVLADAHGHVVHLGERECSIQRRHQKLIEESPSPCVDEALRAEMGAAACRLLALAGYQNAGTVEFLIDADRRFHFLEVNTRLQVEHPVTELVTGIDLVQEQLRIAAGEKLGYAQGDVAARGWAIECRISAEDPAAGFMPSPGRITTWRPPAGPWVRVDAGVYEGGEVPLYYDPLMAKLIVWGRDREEAVRRMSGALAEFAVAGIRTTIPFHRAVMHHPDFLAGRLSTAFVERAFPGGRGLPAPSPERARAAAVAAALRARVLATAPPPAAPDPSRWAMSGRPGPGTGRR
jgi:acetyl/propionyl-CoA carboxylase alpha subunit